jgi:hypothetical protein
MRSGTAILVYRNETLSLYVIGTGGSAMEGLMIAESSYDDSWIASFRTDYFS